MRVTGREWNEMKWNHNRSTIMKKKKNKQLTPFFFPSSKREKVTWGSHNTDGEPVWARAKNKKKTFTDDITILSQSWTRLLCHNLITVGAHFKRTPRRQETAELMNSEQTRPAWNKHTSGSGSEPRPVQPTARPPAPPHRTIHMLNEIIQTDDSTLLSLLALCLCLKSCRDVDKVKPESFPVNAADRLIHKTKG